MRSTIADIAHALKLSKTTVSRALNGKSIINAETKNKVVDYANEIGYYKSHLAAGLTNNKSFLIGVIVPDISNPYFAKVVSGIQDFLFDSDFELMVGQSLESKDREKKLIQRFQSYHIDGLIISCSSKTDSLKECFSANSNLPFIMFDRVTNEKNTYKVIVDDYQATYDATRRLIEKQYQKIVCFAGSEDMSTTYNRINGFRAACDDFYFKNIEVVSLDPEDPELLNTHIASFLKPFKGSLHTAYVGLMDRITMELIACVESQKRMDVGVAGFIDEQFIYPSVGYDVTHITQPTFEIGLVAARQLLKLIDNENVSHTELLKPEIR